MKIHVRAEIRYAEDAEVNGVNESNDSPKMPFMIPNGKHNDGISEFDWTVTIDVEAGKIENWPAGVTAKTYYKICDCFHIKVDGKKEYYDYVPDFFAIFDKGFGDYMYIEIDADGKIKNWNSSSCLNFIEKMESDRN